MGRFDNMTVAQAAVEAYGEELAGEFMENAHRGSVAQAVLGDADQFVEPQHLTHPQKLRMLAYLEEIADKHKMQPA